MRLLQARRDGIQVRFQVRFQLRFQPGIAGIGVIAQEFADLGANLVWVVNHVGVHASRWTPWAATSAGGPVEQPDHLQRSPEDDDRGRLPRLQQR